MPGAHRTDPGLLDPGRLAPDAWGVHAVWRDSKHRTHEVSDETVDRLRHIIGSPPADLDERAPLVVRPGGLLDTGPVEVELEAGGTVDVGGVLPDDFPLGYHWITTPSGLRRRLIVSPGVCLAPPERAWGWAVQLYAARSAMSWGIGDLGDLRTLRTWAKSQGAGFLLVNPLHAVGPTLPQEVSPYLPATRRYLNPLYVCVEEAPGAGLVDLSELGERGRSLNEGTLIDRDAVWQLKDAALRLIFAADEEADDFDQWLDGQGGELHQYALWCALSLGYGADWHDWPAELQDPGSEAAAAYAREHDDEVTYHAWLQWVLARQLSEASAELTLIQDLPIGVSGGGADAWAWQGLSAESMTVGAPPDAFNADGQDWGAPPPVPWRMRADNYEAFAQTVRATMADTGGLRIDHVMGLFRLWWVPSGGSPQDGAYVRYPSSDLLDIVALESHRAAAVVIGEDLGTVEDGVRDDLAEHGILSYRLLLFEDDDPTEWPELAMAAVTTHDLPTIAGLWSGADDEEQQEYAGRTADGTKKGAKTRLKRLLKHGVPPDATPQEAIQESLRALGRAPSVLLCATLEDAVGEVRRPNMPGMSTRPNWCLPLGVRVDDLPTHPGAAALAKTLAAAVGD